MFEISSLLTGGSDADCGPDEHKHGDSNADVGDKRIYARPLGEVIGYDSEHVRNQFIVTRQLYSKNATYRNGKKHYGWNEGKTLFRGTPSEWEDCKKNPEEHFERIPTGWNEIAEHVDTFLELHEDQLGISEYPHGVHQVE